jgi:phenylpyruvate tautomerase PptA (4-oxalocrotonate tautomerase family)
MSSSPGCDDAFEIATVGVRSHVILIPPIPGRHDMPFVRIDITGPKNADYKHALLAGTRAALTTTFEVPDARVSIRVIETPSGEVDVPSCRTDRLTMVDVLMFEGRTPQAKAAMTAALRDALAASPGIEPSEVIVNFREADAVDLDVFRG